MWTEIDDNFILVNFKNFSTKELAQKLGRSQSSVQQRLKKYNIVRERKWIEEENNFLKINHSNLSYLELANRLNRTKSAIQQRCIQFKLRKPRHDIIHDYFKSWSPSMAYILGFTLADGNIQYSKETRYYLQFELSVNDEGVLDFIINEIAPTIKKYYRIVKTKKKESKLVSIHIHSKILTSDLIKLGIKPRKTSKEVLPEIPQEYKCDFLRGLFDGDGNISVREQYYSTRFSISSANKYFLEDVNSQLLFGFGSVTERRKLGYDNPWYEVSIYRKEHLTYLANYMYYPSHPFALERKSSKMLAIARKYYGKSTVRL